MKETEKLPQNKSVPICFIYGSHTEKEIPSLNLLKESIENLNTNTSNDKIAVVLEDAIITESASKIFNDMISTNPSSLESLAQAVFYMQHQRLPGPGEPQDQKVIMNIKEIQPEFRKQELNIIDNLRQAHNNLKIIIEDRPDVPINETFTFRNKYIDRMNQSVQKILRGDFNAGLADFKPATQDMVKNRIERQKRLVEKIIFASNDHEVIGIVGHLGATHTNISDTLIKMSYPNSRKFKDKEQNLLLFDTASELERSLQFFPQTEIPDYKWHSAMIGMAIKAVLDSQPNSEKASSQSIIRQSRQILKKLNLNNMNSVNEFETVVREDGFIQTLITKISA
jgi:ABC-type glutathione transport system ATPase component